MRGGAAAAGWATGGATRFAAVGAGVTALGLAGTAVGPARNRNTVPQRGQFSAAAPFTDSGGNT